MTLQNLKYPILIIKEISYEGPETLDKPLTTPISIISLFEKEKQKTENFLDWMSNPKKTYKWTKEEQLENIQQHSNLN